MEKKPIVYMFSGQGSQYYQMGADLYRTQPQFKQHADELDAIAEGIAGESLLSRIHDPSKKISEPLADASITGAAIYLIECALSKALADLGVEPDIVLGASMGTLASCAVANCFSDEEPLALAFKIGQIAEQTCAAGNMIAVLDSPDIYFSSSALRELSDIAALNFNAGFVISAPEANMPAIETFLKSGNILYQTMVVSRPYHSRWIEPAKAPFLEYFASVGLQTPRIPVICCARAGPLGAATPQSFWEAVRNPIRFSESIIRLEERGPYRYVDLGPSGTLATFLKYALPGQSKSEVYSILSPFGNSQKRFLPVAALAK